MAYLFLEWSIENCFCHATLINGKANLVGMCGARISFVGFRDKDVFITLGAHQMLKSAALSLYVQHGKGGKGS